MKRKASPSKKKKTTTKENETLVLPVQNAPLFPPHPTTAEETYQVMQIAKELKARKV